MKTSRITLFVKILLITIVPIVFLGVTLQIINHSLSSRSMGMIAEQFEETLNHLSDDAIHELVQMSEQSARDLLQEIRIALGNSLQPGETAKFLDLARQQAELEQVEEFSFYGPTGQLELSSNQNTGRTTVPGDILTEARQTRRLVVRGAEESAQTLCFYQPLFMDADMIRMNPEFQVGDFFGMLFVEFNKDRILHSVQAQRSRITEAVETSVRTADSVMSRNLWISVMLVSAFIVVLSVLIIPLVNRSIIRPIKAAIDSNRQIADYLAAAAGQFRSSSETIAQGATEQAAGLEETSSSLEEMSSMTKQNADNAQQANLLSDSASKDAEKGSQLMRQMSLAIDDIQKSSDKTAKIVKVIDEIAFQTNLLALNAAVEAARAGEAGKGFAVVAEEVRNLAMRSAEAAKNTADLIEESTRKAENGVQISGNVGKSLEDIVAGIAKTSGLISEIAAACAEQAQGIDQVNTAVSQMDKVTQQNAGNAEASVVAAEELNKQAEQLQHIVGELVALVGGTSSRAFQAQPSSTGRSACAASAFESDSSDGVFHQIAEGRAKTAAGRTIRKPRVLSKNAASWDQDSPDV